MGGEAIACRVGFAYGGGKVYSLAGRASAECIQVGCFEKSSECSEALRNFYKALKTNLDILL